MVWAKFLSISFVRQIRLPRFAGESNLPPELLATHLGLRRAVGAFSTERERANGAIHRGRPAASPG